MRSLVAKIFLCSLLVQLLTRAAWLALGTLLSTWYPGPGRLLQHALPLYAELAATTLEHNGRRRWPPSSPAASRIRG
ncbi:MAG: hypothetical protein WDN49_18465 [Acetobacteraceae bacterium]